MNQEQTKAAAEIMLQWANDPGAKIECRARGDSVWDSLFEPGWNWDGFEYRVKPKPLTMWAVVVDGKVVCVAKSEEMARLDCEDWMPHHRTARVVKLTETPEC